MSEKSTRLKEPELTHSAPSRVPDETHDNTQEDKPTAVELPGFATPKVEGEIGLLGKYRIQKLLGHGGMGAVYLAFDDRLQRKVALKVMLPKAATNELAKDRFLREARAAAQVNSDYVVNIYEAEEIDGIPYIALQYLQGYPLDQYLKKKGLPSLKESMRIGKEMALGLAAAHELGLVHRDIKPGNIWLEAPKGRVKILDFGLAKAVESRASAELTDSGALVGTPAYMSPEQGMGEKVDARTDLFSMGCVLYRLVTGKLPFDKPTLMGILTAIATEEPTPVQQHNPHVSPELASLIHRLMAKKPANRPASATVVAKELQSLIQQFGQGGESKPLPKVVYAPMAVSVQQSNPFEDIDVETETIAPKPKAEREKPNAKSSMLWLWVMLGFFGLLCCVAAGVIIIKITNKDGSVTELRVPEGTKIEVDGKTIKPEPKKAPEKVTPSAMGPIQSAFTNMFGMEFMKVPKGTGWLGGGGGKPGETKVVIEQDFYLGKYEVTQEEWEKVMGAKPSHFSKVNKTTHAALKNFSDEELKKFPVEQVSWNDCQLFVEQLNKREAGTSWTYRLPTEAEWEYACRGGPVDKLESAFDYYFAKPTNILLANQANFNYALNRTSKVGSYESNRLGLFDMHGNVHEWCSDEYKLQTGTVCRVLKGGSWDHHANDSKASHRYTDPPTLRDGHLGLRVARVPSAPPVAVPAPTVPERKAPGGLPQLGQFGSK
jgi:eukaryotic-like serine/threonine-protein kinase